MTTLVWCAEVGGVYLVASFALAVVIGRCLRSNALDYPLVEGYATQLPAEMAAFEPEDCVPVESRSRVRPVNYSNLRRKLAKATAQNLGTAKSDTSDVRVGATAETV